MRTVNISKLARAAGLSPTIVHNRLHNGWTMEEALSIPKNGRRSKIEPKVAAPTVAPPQANPVITPVVIAILSVCAVTAAWLFNAQH